MTELRPIQRHRILAELGQGGMANVYLAVTEGQPIFSKLVVLKALKRELEAQPASLSMFLDEARLAVQLNHASIAQTYDVGVHEGRHVMVMEYLEGQPLSQVLRVAKDKGRDLPLRLLLRIIVSALEGLQYAHDFASYDGTPLDMVHRDISPQNIFVTYSGHVKVLDFGIAKAATSSTETLTGVVKGKLSYMSPEQLVGVDVDRRADIYAVGCILWAFACGQKLWLGLSDAQIIQRILDGEAIRVPKGLAESQPELARIIEKCLARNASERYQTAAALQHDLERLCDELGPQVRQKEISLVLTELFGDARKELRQHVEAQLKAGASLASNTTSSAEGATNGSGSTAKRRGRRRGIAAGARSHTLAIMVGSVLLALGVTVALGHGAQRQSAAVAPRVENSPAKTTPERVTVRFSVSPPTAMLYLDDAPLPDTSSKVMRADGMRHTLRAEAPGRVSRTVEFVANGDQTLDLSLVPLPEAAPARLEPAPEPSRAARFRPAYRPPPAPATSAVATAPKSKCEKPFFLDDNGIKRVRPECR